MTRAEVQYAITREELKNTENIRLYNVLNGLMHLRNVDIYVTGSNSKMLTKDVLSAFRGRGDELKVFPISFKEYYDFIGGDKSDIYEEYALYGGMPLVLFKKSDAEKMSYLCGLFTEVYFKDIVERYDIALPDVLEELTDDLCSSIGSLTNASKIANTLQSVKGVKVSSTTISSYLNYLIESFLFSNAKRYDVKGKKYFEYPSKYYCTDIGLRNARLNFRQQEETHIMENVIYNELLCRGYSVDVGVVEIVERKDNKQSKKQCEIDFVVNVGSKKYYIQSALNVSDPTKMDMMLGDAELSRRFSMQDEAEQKARIDREQANELEYVDESQKPDATDSANSSNGSAGAKPVRNPEREKPKWEDTITNRMLHWSYTPEQKEEVKKALAAGVPKATILTYFYPEVSVEKMSSYRKKQ